MLATIKITRLKNAEGLPLPSYATEHSAGMDLLSAIDTEVVLKPHERQLIPTGISIALPSGFEAQVRSRSGLAVKHGISVLNAPGTIDADYRGEIKVILINHSNDDFVVTRGMRIAQMVIARYAHVLLEEVESLDETDRGKNGFGSTGLKEMCLS